jgi:CheY-like chemotaxis protein
VRVIFNGFAENSMLEQIRILEQIAMDNDVRAIDPLLALYGSHECDQAVEEVIYHTLQQLMKGSEKAVISGLNHTSIEIQLLAMRCGCECHSGQFQSYLIEKLQDVTDPVLLAEIIRSMAGFADPELITLLLPYMHHDDAAVAGSCIDLLASLGGKRARDGLIDLIRAEVDNVRQLGGCSFVAALGMDCLSRFADEVTLQFLIQNIHHDSPTFRRLVSETLIKIGGDCVPALIQCVQSGQIDEKIMAANTIGFIRHRKGAELLIAELDAEYAADGNIRFAMFEAIGRIDCLRSALCLADALSAEKDEFVLNAVLVGLERICHPGLARVFLELAENESWVQGMVKKLLALRFKNILKIIYDIPEYRQFILQEAGHCQDKKLQRFCRFIFRDSVYPFPDMECSSGSDNDFVRLFVGKKIVVADDSKAIIRFYEEVALETGFDIVSFYDGQEALDYFQEKPETERVDLLLTDMNMPNKDGIELVKELRQMACFQYLPILMATTESESLQWEVALEAGVSQIISKPFSREGLIGKLQDMLCPA